MTCILYRLCPSDKGQDFPLDNLVYFGLYQKDHLWNAYTYGMQDFHKEEMEILHVDMNPMDLRNMLFDIAYYVLTSNVVLKDGRNDWIFTGSALTNHVLQRRSSGRQ